VFGVTRIPPQYRDALTEFEGAFTDERNFTSFLPFTSALINAESQWSVAALTRGISHPDAKSREAYDYFLGDAAWSMSRLAQLLVDYALTQLDVGEGDHILLLIDDTFVGKDEDGDATDGVAKLYNPATGQKEWGNKFVTSCLFFGDVYLPYQARMYIPEHLSDEFDEPFKTKLKIALEDIVQPLQLPAGVACTVVHDNAYMAVDEVSDTCGLGYDVVTRLQSDRRIQPPGRFGKRNVEDFAEMLEYDEVTVEVRGKEKTYLVADSPVVIPDLGGVRLFVTKTDEERRFYVSTNLDLSRVEILRCVGQRWNIETLHQEIEDKFGFDQYELERKQAIERFFQLIFVAWTVTVLTSEVDEALWDDHGGLAVSVVPISPLR
jgi:hypothetical protein